MKKSVVIIDDEQPARRLLENYISKVDFLKFSGSFRSPINALSAIKNQDIDAIFLDIRMPEMSGLDFLKTLTDTPEIILTTAYREYALEGYEFNVVDYLLKPIAFDRFLKAVNKLNVDTNEYTQITTSQKSIAPLDYIHLKYNKKLFKIATKDILFIKGENEYVNYYLENKEKLLIYGTLRELENKLPSTAFCRVHRSYIVNLKAIEYIEGNRLTIGNSKIPISDTYKKMLLEKWNS